MKNTKANNAINAATLQTMTPAQLKAIVTAIEKEEATLDIKDLALNEENDLLTYAVTHGKPQDLNKAYKAKLKENSTPILYDGQPLLDTVGNPWTYYRIASNSLWGLATQELRAADIQTFYLEYADDLLQEALVTLYDLAKIEAYKQRYNAKVAKGSKEEIAPEKLHLKAHFTVAQTAIKAAIRANHSINYVKRVNDDGTTYAPEKIDNGEYLYTDDNGIHHYSYTGNQTLEARYSVHKGTTITYNPDVTYKGVTGLSDAENMAQSEEGMTCKELEMLLLMMTLKSKLPQSRYENAVKLLNGQIEWRSLRGETRKAIRETMIEIATM